MNVFARSFSLTSVALTLCALQPGCTADSVYSGEDESDPPVTAVSATSPIVTLTPLDAVQAPVLGRVAQDFDVVDIQALTGTSHRLADIQAARQAVVGAAAVVADLGRLTSEDLSAYGYILREAKRFGVPIVLENVHGEHRAKMTALIGIGLEADVVVAEPSERGSRYMLTVHGDPTDSVLGLGQELPEGLSTLLDGRLANVERALQDAASGTSGTRVAIDPDAAAAEVMGKLLARIESGAPTQILMSGNLELEGAYRYYHIDFPVLSWSPTSNQTASLDVDFEIELMASTTPEGKFMVVSPKGSGAHPGALRWNGNKDRGYYQESVDALVMPIMNGLIAYDHAPASTNRSNTFSTSNGVAFGADGDGASFSVSQTDTMSVTLNDFGVTDDTIGIVSAWSFEMTAAGGDVYHDWEDLQNGSKLHNLPPLATSALMPDFETIYRTQSPNFSGTVPFMLFSQQTLRKVWCAADSGLWCHDWDTAVQANGAVKNVDVDFSQVNIPRFGTAPFTEPFSVSSGNWTVVNEGVDDASPAWSISNGIAREVGNAHDAFSEEEVVPKRGTYLWNDKTRFGHGSLQAKMYAGDNDAYGLIYGIQGPMESYYRASFDRERSIARLVRVDNGVFTVLAQDTSFLPPMNTWMTMRVERSGSQHRVYFNNQLVLTATDTTFQNAANPYGTGSVALYSWGMSDVRFDDLQISLPPSL